MSQPLDYLPTNRHRDGANRLIYPLAIVTTAATLLLIFMGGLVTSHGAGMSVPDWPNSYGYNMFTFPVSKWVGGIFYEHTHRLMGSLVGFCSLLMFLHAWGLGATRKRKTAQVAVAMAIVSAVALACAFLPAATGAQVTSSQPLSNPHLTSVDTFKIVAELTGVLAVVGLYGLLCRRPDTRPYIRGLALAVLLGVIFQGLLGGFRVVLIQLGLAIIHACVAQAFLCLVALLASMSSHRWRTKTWNAAGLSPMVVSLIAITLFAIYGQLIAGALMRHDQAGLAIPDLPLAYGHVLPPMNETQLKQANILRLESGDPRYTFPGITAVTLPQIWLHFAHRCGAIVVTCLLGATVIWILTRLTEPALRRPALLLAGLLLTQLTLGVLTVLWRKPADIASTHVAVGAATLMTTFILYIRARRALKNRVPAAQSVRAFSLEPVAVFA